MVVVLYGAIMQPTPDSASVALLAWSAIALPVFAYAVRYVGAFRAYNLLLTGALFIGLTSAASNAVDPAQLARDLVSVVFWLAGPMLLIMMTRPGRTGVPWIDLEMARLVLAIAGALLSLRYVLNQGVSFALVFRQNLRADMEYLSSEPLVTFAFIYSGVMVFRTQRSSSSLAFLALFAISSLGLIAVTYRGPLILGFSCFVVATVVFLLQKTVTKPLRALTVLFLLGFAVFYSLPLLEGIAEKLTRKFTTVGTNSKVQEFAETFARNTDFLGQLFGDGFGVKAEIAGAGHSQTGYTHNVLSYAFLKTGYLGLALTVAAFAVALRAISRTPAMTLAHAPEALTLLYIGLFQGAYKHLGFGLLLGLCLCAAQRSSYRSSIMGLRLGHLRFGKRRSRDGEASPSLAIH